MADSLKSRLAATLLCLFVGVFGIHRFYVGKIGSGIIMLLLSATGIGEIWAFIDLILILCGQFKDSDGNLITNWN